MSDRVENELRRVSTALAELSPPKPDLPRPAEAKRKPRMLAAVASFLVVLGIGLAAGFLFDTEEQLGTGIVQIPDDHVANEILAFEADATEIADLAPEMGFEFACGGSPLAGVESCVLWEDNVAVVIPFRAPDGVTAEVSTPFRDGRLEIPFEVGEPVGVRHDTGLFTVLHGVPGYETPFSYGSYLPASSGP